MEADLYLQVMGDEPLINAAAFDLILPKTLPQDPYYVAVLTNVMEHPADVVDFSNQKVVTNAAREILMISRSPIPYRKARWISSTRRSPASNCTAAGRWPSTTTPPSRCWKRPRKTT